MRFALFCLLSLKAMNFVSVIVLFLLCVCGGVGVEGLRLARRYKCTLSLSMSPGSQCLWVNPRPIHSWIYGFITDFSTLYKGGDRARATWHLQNNSTWLVAGSRWGSKSMLQMHILGLHPWNKVTFSSQVSLEDFQVLINISLRFIVNRIPKNKAIPSINTNTKKLDCT